MLVDDALNNGGRGGGADLAHRRQLVRIVPPRRIRRIDVLRGAGRGQLGLVGERARLLEIADDAVAYGNGQGRDEHDDAAESVTRLRTGTDPLPGVHSPAVGCSRASSFAITGAGRRPRCSWQRLENDAGVQCVTCGSPQGSVPPAVSIQAGA